MTEPDTDVSFRRIFHLPVASVDVPVSDCGEPLPEGTEPAFEVNTIAHLIPMSRELARLAGLVPSTPEEVAEDARRRVEFEAEVAAAWGAYDALCEALAGVTDPALRAVLDLHDHNPDADHYMLVCAGCDVAGMEAEQPAWPCRTVTTIAAVLFPDLPPPEAWMLTRRRDRETGKWDRP